jgi:pyridoxamine 5'-phosphate oxidase
VTAANEPADPIARFADALARAERSEPALPNAVTLATADATGRPSARVVLLKGTDARGFVFYTSYESQKARDLEQNPRAALCFHWKSLGEQVRVEGRVERVTPAESDAYFATRPQPSQLAAIASWQSAPLSSRAELEERFAALDRRYAGAPAPRPPTWGGYRLVAERVEFWFHRESRLHHRVLYELDAAGGWRVSLLFP